MFIKKIEEPYLNSKAKLIQKHGLVENKSIKSGKVQTRNTIVTLGTLMPGSFSIIEKANPERNKISYPSFENVTDSSLQNHYSKEKLRKLSVNVHAALMPLPLGLLTIQGLFNEEINHFKIKN